MDAGARGGEEPHGPGPNLRPLVLSPGVVEERYLVGPSPTLGKVLREDLLRHLRQVAGAVYSYEDGGAACGRVASDGVEGNGVRKQG